MTRIEHRIRDRIAADGPIPVAEFMALATGDPVDGYYATRDPFGAAGDFITAPEISQVFGELIGLWCAVAWQQMGAPGRVVLAELGPGRGTLMADAIRAAGTAPAFLEAAEIHLVETSPALRARQRETLGATATVWHDHLDDVPPGPILLIANEFFDALPIEQFVRTDDGWRRRCVGLDASSEELCFVTANGPPVDETVIPEPMRRVAPGEICEINPPATALAADIGRRLAQYGGAALIIDYGPAASAPGDSLQAVSRQRYHDVLADPGEADITAHVDFQALAKAATAGGATAFGPIPQGVFLGRLGIEQRCEILANSAGPEQVAALRDSCRRLTDRDRMGMLFKALALTGPDAAAPAGFEGAC